MVIAWSSILFGLLLYIADRFAAKERPAEKASLRDWLAIGVAQAFALIPGASRSGVTMTAALGLRFDREAAARLSFLLAIPAGLMVAAKDGLDLVRGDIDLTAQLVPMLVVVLVSAVIGYLVIDLLLSWLRRRSMTPFVIYRIALGVVLLLIAA